jgi:hypothetical protein
MRPSIRLTGLLATLSLVISIPVTSGFACERNSGGDHMAGMAMANPSNAGSATSIIASISGETPASPAAPCQLPWAPSGCQSMVPCSPTAVAAESVVLPELEPTLLRVESAIFLTPPSETKPPELPPPRA